MIKSFRGGTKGAAPKFYCSKKHHARNPQKVGVVLFSMILECFVFFLYSTINSQAEVHL